MRRLILLILVFAMSVVLSAQTAEELEALGLGDPNIPAVQHPHHPTREIPPEGIILVPESSGDVIMAFDPDTGDLINAAFITLDPTVSSTPIEIIMHPFGEWLLVSDQLADVIHKYDLDGNYIGVFAPAGGANTSIIDNMRGIYARPDDGHVLATCAAGGNADSVVEFDENGAYVGTFVAPSAGGLNGPWEILFREAVPEYLVNGSDCDMLHRYDESGTYTSDLCALPGMFEQMYQCESGTILGANFSSSTYAAGIHEFAADGSYIGFYGPTGYSSFRGVYELPNGHILCSNSSGVYEIDRTGTLIDTKFSGGSPRYINFVEPVNQLPAPHDLVYTVQNVNDVALTWQEPDTTRLVLQGYNLYRDAAVIQTFGADVLDYIDEGLDWGTYSYYVTAIWDEGESGRSNTVTVELLEPLIPPANLTATLTDGDVELDWDMPMTSRVLQGYVVYRNGTQLVQINDPDLTEYTDAGPQPGEYSYHVIAMYTSGDSDPSNIATITVPDFTPPLNLEVTVTENDLHYEWDPPANALTVTHYRIYRNALQIEEVAATQTSYNETDLPAGEYACNVTAVYDGGVESDNSNTANPSVVFVAPQNLQADVNGDDVTLTWEAPVRGVTGYMIYRDDTQLTSVTDLTYTDMDVSAGQHEYYVTTIYSGEYESEPSNTEEVEIVGVSDPSLVPAVTEITGNYPNPFNPTTEVRFGLAKDGVARLDVYNLLGQRVATLANGRMEAGWHSVVWNGDDDNGRTVGSGVYLMRLSNGGRVYIHKVVLLK